MRKWAETAFRYAVVALLAGILATLVRGVVLLTEVNEAVQFFLYMVLRAS